MTSKPAVPIEVQYKLARAWHAKGTLIRAIAGYRDVLAAEPGHAKAALLLGGLLSEQFRRDEALTIFREGVGHNPHDSQLHKQFVNLMLLQEDMDAVFRHYRLERVDSRVLELRVNEVVVCTVLRDERARLPNYLDYYRRKGVRTFFAVDNGSTDGSLEYLLVQPDVYVWRSLLSFHEANFGAAWFEPILRLHAQRHWCLIADLDELFYYPDCEQRGIPELCQALDHAGMRAYSAILLDMYGELAVADTHYAEGRPFEEVCPYFDRQWHHTSYPNGGPFQNQTCYFGGMRERIFGKDGGYILNKVPLIRYSWDTILAGGQHWTNIEPEKIAKESGALLHFKFFSTFQEYASRIAGREHVSNWIVQHQEYERGLAGERALTFYDPACSVRLENSEQLVQLGIMQRDATTRLPAQIEFPRIAPITVGTARPLWSVILTVYRRTRYLSEALQSVLAQAASREDMEIEVVCDGPHHPIHGELEALVRSIAGDRVTLYFHDQCAGHPEIFNLCVRRARGRWIHLLHDDDWVAPGFYAALEQGIRHAPEIGAAFCRHDHVGDHERVVHTSPLERETPGTVEGWLERIAGVCRLQTASVVVRREAYERLGGYCPQARSAFDWEMWQRLAVHYPVWFEPRVLAFFRESDSSESSRLIASGGQIADSRAAMAVAQTYLPEHSATRLGKRAAEIYAMRAVDLALQQLAARNLPGALANIREALLCSESEEVRYRLRSLLTRVQSVPE